ncbi:hypothetical protein OAV45_03830 [Candidatus Poseidoniales archaeon]|nr:hypothetical protein [Candidatus Poseidoniales archaeon]
MSSKDEFQIASEKLKERHDSYEKIPETWRSFRQNTWIFDNSSAWSFLYEIIQNAVDVNATAIKIHFDEDHGSLVVQHNGTELLNSAAIQGLCGFSLSTKGLDGIGFMGIGFKSFLGFFSRVIISDKSISFRVEAPRPEGSNKPNIKRLFFPEWVKESPVIDDGMTTIFRFEEPYIGNAGKFQGAFTTFDPLWLAVFGKRGLSKFVLQEHEYVFSDAKEGVMIQLQAEEKNHQWNYLILEKNVIFDEEATKELKERRDMETYPQKTTQRKVRLIKELEILSEKSNEETIQRIYPKEMETGEMFCLVPLGDKFPFPFKIGIDSDWIIDPTRTKLVQETSGGVWHKTLLSSMPELLKRYFDSLPSEMSASDRKACLSIFPESDEKISPALSFLESKEFYDSLKKSLSDSKFILCTDGTIRSPSEVRDIPKKPNGMSDEYYRKFTQQCFSCPLVDRTSISTTAVSYLWDKLGFLAYPEDEEIITKKVQEMWDESDNYLHLLDILDDLTQHEKENEQGENVPIRVEHGPKVIPGHKKGVWMSLRSPNMAFMSLPKSGKGLEKPLYNLLTEKYPGIKNVIEVHPKLQGTRNRNSPGRAWRENALAIAVKIQGKIESLTIPKEEEFVISIYRYAFRLNKPEFVKYLHTPGGCRIAKDCLIGPPYGNEMMERMAPDSVISEEIKKASNGRPRADVLSFLKDVGAVSLVPTKHSREVTHAEGEKFLGLQPKYTTRYRRAVDWVWPIPFSDCDATELGNYFDQINENEELQSAIRNAKRTKQLKYFYQTNRTQHSKKRSSWLEDLVDYPWVPCADGEFRTPLESKQAAIDEQKEGKHSILSDTSMQFFINNVKLVFGDNIPDDDHARIEFWKSHLASNHLTEFLTTLDRIRDEGKATSMLDDILEIKWKTRGENTSAPIRRFLIDPETNYGGFIGHWSDIVEKVRVFFQVVGYEPESSITADLAKEYVTHVSSSVDEISAEIFSNLRNANSAIMDNEYDFTGCSFLTYDEHWITIESGEYYFIQLSHDPIPRFGELKHRILHPNQFPVGINKLRELYNDSTQFKLIDNEVEITSEMSENNSKAVAMMRVVESLKLADLDILLSVDDGIDLSIEDIQTKTHYLIQDEDERTQIYVSSNTKYWAGPVSKFLCEQAGFFGDMVEMVRICLQSEEKEFETVYSQLCEMGLDRYDTETVLTNHQYLNTKKDLEGSKFDDSPRKRRDLELEVAEATLAKPTESSNDTGNSTTGEPKRKDKTGHRTKSRPKVVSKGTKEQKKSKHEAKSDEATVQMVVNELKKMGWKPLADGHEMRMDANQEGFDIQATHPDNDILWRVECKGRVAKWGPSNVEISERQMHHALEFNGKEINGKTIQYTLAVIEESESTPKVRFVPFMEYDLKFVFSRNDWNQDSKLDTGIE